jgi:hypothetical protein
MQLMPSRASITLDVLYKPQKVIKRKKDKFISVTGRAGL